MVPPVQRNFFEWPECLGHISTRFRRTLRAPHPSPAGWKMWPGSFAAMPRFSRVFCIPCCRCRPCRTRWRITVGRFMMLRGGSSSKSWRLSSRYWLLSPSPEQGGAMVKKNPFLQSKSTYFPAKFSASFLFCFVGSKRELNCLNPSGKYLSAALYCKLVFQLF